MFIEKIMKKLLVIAFLSPMVFGSGMWWEIPSEAFPTTTPKKPLNPNAQEFKPKNTGGNTLSKTTPKPASLSETTLGSIHADPQLVPEMTLPATYNAPAPVGKKFADKFSDLPKGVSHSPKVSVLIKGTVKYCEREGRLLPRPDPKTIRFNLRTGSWELEDFVDKGIGWESFYS